MQHQEIMKADIKAHAHWNADGSTNSPSAEASKDDPSTRYRAIRHQSEVICATLHVDDFNLQAMPETSPPKWHLAHTTWFLENFVLTPFVDNYTPYNAHFATLFNSYYTSLGTAAFPRPQRGLLTRPTTAEIFTYRAAIDQKIHELLHSGHSQHEAITRRIELALQHEQQHQELLLTDIKYGFSLNPLCPVFCERVIPSKTHVFSLQEAEKLRWIEFEQRLCEVGAGGDAFYFDNEGPRHTVLVHAFALAERLITNAEYLEFIKDHGYERPELWLADGWSQVEKNRWQAPLYWRRQGHNWSVFTLHGEVPLAGNEPVCHVSYYEADAYARWAGARLPTEFEWESVACTQCSDGHFIDDGILHPRAAGCEQHPASRGHDQNKAGSDANKVRQLFGDVWEWTASAYAPYPGYTPPAGAIGEYNGKFMCNQMVLRGGSCISARNHLRASYRNFFYPSDRWQFSGIRLARSLM